MKRVAVIGAHSVGKTTLVDEIFQDERIVNSDILKIDEQARDFLTRYGLDYQNMDLVTFEALEYALYYYFKYSFMINRSFISDRSPLDVFAYMSTRLSLDKVNILRAEFMDYRNEMFKNTKIYFYTCDGHDVLIPNNENSSIKDIENRMKLYVNELIYAPAKNCPEHYSDIPVKYFSRKDIEFIKEEIIDYMVSK